MPGLVVRGATVLDPRLPLAQADIRIAGDVITEVGPGLPTEGDDRLDAEGMVAMPGLINAHTHSAQYLDRGVSPNLPLDLMLMWMRAGGTRFSRDDVHTLAVSGALEMLRTGCTAVLDHASVDIDDQDAQYNVLLSAYADAGIRASVAAAVFDLDFFQSLPLHLVPDLEAPPGLVAPADTDQALAAVERFVERWAGRHPRLSPMIAPSAPQRCSDRLLVEANAIAKRHRTGLHTHLLESKSQVFATRTRYGTSVVSHLRTLGLLGPHASFAHCVWLDADEQSLLARSGATIVHNPVSNLRTGSGIMPLQALLRRGASVALGTDGAVSNDSQNMFEVLKFASLIHTLYGRSSEWPSAARLWTACLDGGAAALGKRLGTLAPGAKADIVLLRLDRHVPATKEQLVNSLTLSEHGESVDMVLVGGEVMIRHGRSTRIDEADLSRRALALMERINGGYERRAQAFRPWEAVLTRIEEAVSAAALPTRRLLEMT